MALLPSDKCGVGRLKSEHCGLLSRKKTAQSEVMRTRKSQARQRKRVNRLEFRNTARMIPWVSRRRRRRPIVSPEMSWSRSRGSALPGENGRAGAHDGSLHSQLNTRL